MLASLHCLSLNRLADTGINTNHDQFEGRARWGFSITSQEIDGYVPNYATYALVSYFVTLQKWPR